MARIVSKQPLVPVRLLAKSYDARHGDQPPDYALLTRHSRDVAEASRALVRTVGSAALRAADLPTTMLERLERTVCLNGWLQDIGKANDHFQTMVTTDPKITQLVRHEAISALLAWTHPPLRAWLEQFGDDLPIAIWGAVGHHRKFDNCVDPPQVLPATIFVAHPDFRSILEQLAIDLGFTPPPPFERNLTLGRSPIDACDLNATKGVYALHNEFQERENAFVDLPQRRFLALVKTFGIAADVTASAVAPRLAEAEFSHGIQHFVETQLDAGLTTGDIERLVARWAWARMPKASDGGDQTTLPPEFIVRPFQHQVAASESCVTLAQAGCGSGKSLAAYLWAQAWSARFAHQGFDAPRVFFCLPTTGTTTEHFKDYALEAGVEAKLAHQRATVDLVAIARTAAQEDDTGIEEQVKASLAAERAKIEALSLWSVPFVVSTADTVLGLLANGLRALCSLPAILQSCIVFDEIHAFDATMFGHLLMFLKALPNLPVLLMTASLPQSRLDALRAVRPDLAVIAGPPEFENLPRYQIHQAGPKDDVWGAVGECIAHGGKVLWVRNQVASANDTYHQARMRFPGARVDVYHSRFRYKDRSRRHRRVIDRFKDTEGGALLIATQVAEMSLDLSADLLITDEAPISALIQRFGRLNRRADPAKQPDAKSALICKPSGGNRPYERDEIASAKRWIDALCALSRPLSQRDLAEHFKAHGTERTVDLCAAEKDAYFLGLPGHSGIWRTRPGTTRAEGYTMSVILEADLHHFRMVAGRDEPDRDWIRAHEVAIPIKKEMFHWNRVRGIYVASHDAVHYDYDESTHEGTGAQWREK